MLYVIRCDCGIDMEAPSEEEVLDQGIEHAKVEHAMTVTYDQIRPMVEKVDA